MSLEDVYSNQVKGQVVGGLPYMGSAAPPIIERDPNVRKLEQEVFARMHELVEPVLQPQQAAVADVAFVSMEDALKELAQMNK